MVDFDFSKIFDAENIYFTSQVITNLQPDRHKQTIMTFIHKRTANIHLLLSYLAKKTPIASYAEIGVRRGFSMAVVGARRPQACLVGFDLWIDNYGDATNPGPSLVSQELLGVGHHGQLRLIAGNSLKTVPAYDGPANFGLALVDGGHSFEEAYWDILNIYPMLSEGAYLVVDDVQDKTVFTALDRASQKLGKSYTFQDRVGLIVK